MIAEPPPSNAVLPALHGLVLAGGASRRMGRDKAALVYDAQPQLAVAFALLAPRVEACFVSVRPDQRDEPLRAAFPRLVDLRDDIGPASGLLAAHAHAPEAAWLAIACDLPNLDAAALDCLIAGRAPQFDAVAFRGARDALPEPLCAIWEPAALRRLRAQVDAGRFSPRRALDADAVRLLDLPAPHVLDNANTPDDLARLRGGIRHG
ncbi:MULTISPECIES: NTP transferase domain-containing protein [Pseudoxanthomonas]|jgi:molybdopterin-guanine dinucleotide biosynthesis protein A|uniref:NTP transferase domain-containing protein n=1 Tax=Pseudoxanthomonas TaxID=83618 RepID=UPI00197F3519|nr:MULTISPECIES: NTP transferase domain-containing protein [Pseudoxanthomonas]UAY75620.1 NTP transferase domain-containing protein [Pseudoxanthomonas sp. X-1]